MQSNKNRINEVNMGNLTGVDLSGLAEPITKLIEVVSSGVGKVYEPTHIRRVAKAEADKIDILSEAIASNTETPINYSSGEISIESSTKQLLQRANNRLRYQELKKQQNIESVIGSAYEQLELEHEVSKNPVDSDWISRFFNIAGEINDEQMRKLWGKILADEIKKPQSFSMRTLDILRNMTKHEADTFEKVSQVAFSHPDYIALPYGNQYRKQFNLSYEDILLLSECGLINISESYIGDGFGDEVNSETIKDNSIVAGDYAIIYNIKKEYIHEEHKGGELPKIPYIIPSFSFSLFTQSGRELYSIVDVVQNIETLKIFCRFCVEKTFFENIRIHKILNLSETSLDCDESVNLLETV